MPLPPTVVFPHLTQFQIPGRITQFRALSDNTGDFYTPSPPNPTMVVANAETFICHGAVGTVFEGEQVTCHVPIGSVVTWCTLDLRSCFLNTVPFDAGLSENHLGAYIDGNQVDLVTVSLDIDLTGDLGSSGCALRADGAPQCGALEGSSQPDAAFDSPSFGYETWELITPAGIDFSGYLKRTDDVASWPYQYDPVNGAYLFTPEELASLRIRTPNPGGAWLMNTSWTLRVVGYKWQPGYDPDAPPRLMMVI